MMTGDDDSDPSSELVTFDEPDPPPVERRKLVGEPHLWDVKRSFQIEFLVDEGLEPHHRLLDVGCGTLRGGAPLIDYLEAGHYVGVESRYEPMKEGLEELLRHDLEEKRPIFLTADLLSVVDYLPSFDFIWAFAVLFHMRDPVLEDTLSFVSRHLNDGCAFYANVETGERKEEGWLEFPVIQRPLEWYREKAADQGLTVENLGTLRSLGHRSELERDDEQLMLKFERA